MRGAASFGWRPLFCHWLLAVCAGGGAQGARQALRGALVLSPAVSSDILSESSPESLSGYPELPYRVVTELMTQRLAGIQTLPHSTGVPSSRRTS